MNNPLGPWNVNRNPVTGVRYGVVAMHSLADWVWDEFFYNGTDETSAAIEREWLAEHPDDDELPEDFWDDVHPEECEYSLETDDGLSVGLSYLGGAALVWVYKSPVTACARLCSPCVPGAGDLDNLDVEGELCYSLPAEWFRDYEEPEAVEAAVRGACEAVIVDEGVSGA